MKMRIASDGGDCVKIYIINGSQGEYSDRSMWNVSAWRTEKEAHTEAWRISSLSRAELKASGYLPEGSWGDPGFYVDEIELRGQDGVRCSSCDRERDEERYRAGDRCPGCGFREVSGTQSDPRQLLS